MTTPTLRVELATTDGPFTASPTWTTLPSTDVLSFGMTEGRTSVTDSLTQPSTCSVTFDNSQRVYDPAYTSGTYYSSLKPGRQIRVTAIEADLTEHVLFRGIVGKEGFQQQSYQHPNTSRSVVQCVDVFGFLASWSADLPPFESYLRQLAVAAGVYPSSTRGLYHWRLDDSGSETFSGTQTFNQPAGETDVYGVKGCGFYLAGSGVSGQSSGLVQPSNVHDSSVALRSPLSGSLDGGAGAAYCDIQPMWFGSTTYVANTTFGFAVRLRSLPTVDRAALAGNYSFGALNGFFLDRDGTLSMCYDHGTTDLVSTGDTLELGRTYFITSTWDEAATTLTMYVDGAQVAQNTSYPSLGANISASNLYFGRWLPTQPYANYSDAFALKATATATEVSVLYGLWGGFKGLKTGDAAARLLGWLGIPNNCSGGRVSLAEQGSAATPTAILQAVEQTELGRLYYHHADEQVEMVSLQNFATATRQTAAQFTLSDQAADTGAGFLRYSSPTLVNLAAVNSVTASNQASSWTRRDETSVAAFGVSPTSTRLIADAELDPLGVAEFMLDRGADPVTAINSVAVDPTSAAEFGTILDAELFDLVTVKRQPHALGSVLSVSMFLEGRSYSIGDGTNDWSVSLFLRTSDGYPYWLWGAGLFDTNGVDSNGKKLAA